MADSSEPYEGTQIRLAVEAIHEQLNDPTVLLQFGRAAIDENTQRRRIVWVRPGGTAEPPSRAGGMYRSPQEAATENLPTTGAPAATPNGNRVQFCYEPVDTVLAHLYAESDATLERLFYNLLAATKKACGHLVQPGLYVWPYETDGSSGLGKRQPKLVLNLTFRFAAPDEVAGLFIVLSEQHTHVFNGGGESTDVHS